MRPTSQFFDFLIIELCMIERRAYPRMLDCELVIVHWNDGSRDLQQLGNVDDVSLGGMGIRCDYSIPAGTAVQISYEAESGGTLSGVVKYYLERPEGFFLGIELSDQARNRYLPSTLIFSQP